ncbi:hypothetical protein RIF29_30337 [Crotalaria pallida]|uniref:Uncharacterized protein n=1 Tax=Crotalaria pallida TaxID=3830 RepID=A0AAN9EGD2_CROPI
MKPSEGMGFSLDPRKISSKRRNSSKTTKESDKPKKPDKLKSKTSVGPSCSDYYHNKGRQDAIGKIQNRESVKGSSMQRDELVKYMSNLPGFLQHSDRGEHIQEKALNVGVLDWSRLEKWKNKQTHIPAVASSLGSFNNSQESSSSSRHKKVGDKKSLHSSCNKASYKESLPESSNLSSQDVKLYQYFEAEPIETMSIEEENRMRPWEFESLGKNQSDASIRNEKRNGYDKIISLGEHFALKSRHHGVSPVPDEIASADVEAKKIKEDLQQRSLQKKEKNQKSSSHKGLPSLKSKYKAVSSDSQKKTSSSHYKAKKKMDHWKEPDIEVAEKQIHRKPSNIVLLRPRLIPQYSSQDCSYLSQLRGSSDETFSESSRSSSSYSSFPEEVYTEDLYSEITHSSVLPFSAEFASSETMEQSVNTDLEIDHSSIASKKPACSNKMSSLQSKDTSMEKDVLDVKLRNQCAFSNMKELLDQETAELIDQSGRKGSSHHRLSFGLNQIGRSLSFKERSTLPQLSSMYAKAKSGPLTSESSASLNNSSSKEKVNGHNRTRSSSLRWLLDPILNHKASNIRQSAEIGPATKGSLDSINLNAEKSNGTQIQALLQLTIKNGIPLFKFVLNNERKVLAATMNSSLEKDEIGCYFTFYLVNEVKKKSGGWMSRGSKEKSCGYVYNIIGQMKLSSYKITEPMNQNSDRQSLVKEYVLLGVETDHLGQGPPIKSQELAAVVNEIPCENLSHEGPLSNDLLKKGCLKCSADEKCFCMAGANDISFSTTVILPGGVHSSSNHGEPSPLIHRWKSGGLCDCGGWDVGCKLLVLSNQKQSPNISRSRVQLFVQEGAGKNTPLFSLAPLKDGFYSVEFTSTITHLQAFFISVVFLSSQKLPSSMNKNEFQEKASINYNPIPPLSPVGRV